MSYLGQTIATMLDEGQIPLVWDKKLPYVAQNRFDKNVRNDGKDPVENEEDLDLDLDDEDDVDLEDDMGDEDDLVDYEIDDETDFEDLDDEEEDPDRQGLIRVVPDAHLVYKRSAEDGSFEELWIYNTGDSYESEIDTRRAILAGTDIPLNKMTSDDGSQSYTVWTAGNGQMVHITGLPS